MTHDSLTHLTHSNFFLGCVKENVLRFVWKLTQPRRNCSVMVSLVIRDTIAEGNEKIFPTISGGNGKKYVTCLGFLEVIRDKELFNSEDGDILLRPDTTIPWDDCDTERKPSLEGINGNNVQVFASVIVHPKGGEQTKDLIEWFVDNNIAYDSPDDPIHGDMVRITSLANYGHHGLVVARTLQSAKVVLFEGNDQLPKTKRLTSCQKLPENEDTDRMQQWIKWRLA